MIRNKYKNILIASLFAFSASNASAISREEFCDFDKYKKDFSIEIQFSPLAMSSKLMGRSRFNNTDIYPHFFYGYNDKEPVREKSIVHRDGLIQGDEFYRVNEGNSEDPKWVRYYTVFTENCEKIYLRLDENTPEFQSYWSNRGGMVLNIDDFIKIRSSEINVIREDSINEIEKLSDQWVTMAPLRGGKDWLSKKNDNTFEILNLSPKQKFKIKKVTKKPFIYRGIKLSSLTIKAVSEDGKTYVLPGYAQSLILWNKHKGVPLRKGSSKDVLLAHKGIPDKIEYLPVFKTYSGKVIIEDPILKQRVSSESEIYSSEIEDGRRIGSLEEYIYLDNEGFEESSYLIDMKGKIVNQ